MIRVFPRKTNLTPIDDKVYFTGPPLIDLDDRDVFISVTFIEDKPKAERLAELWEARDYVVTVDGPAYDNYGQNFVPGRFVKKGAVFTSRGCNNKCWFCYVHKREGRIREIPITDGWNVLDSNLLQCSEDHIRNVFDMLKKQPKRATFTGGLEAAILKPWHCELLREINFKTLFFAYDTPEDWEPLVEVIELFNREKIKINRHKMFVYVLIGYPTDTIDKALKRLENVKALGFCPFAMLFESNKKKPLWDKLQREWARPAIIYKNHKEEKFFGK